MNEIKMLKIKDVIPTPDNPRQIRDDDPKVAELAESIKATGLLQPVVCRPHPQMPGKYDLRAGFRRYLAHMLNDAKEIMAIVREMDDKTAMEVTVLENLQREQLTPLEEARGIRALLDTGHNVRQIADEIGKTPTWVLRRASLARLSKMMMNAVRDENNVWSRASSALLCLIARLPQDRQDSIAKKDTWMVNRPVAEVAQHLEAEERLLSAAIWKLDDETLCTCTCVECSARSDVQPELFYDEDTPPVDIKMNARCLHPGCWEQKFQESVIKITAEMREEYGDDLITITEMYNSPVAFSHYIFEVEKCKKSTPGARPALIIRSHGIEKCWVKVKNTDKDDRKPASSRQPTREQKRMAWAINIVAKEVEQYQANAPAILTLQHVAMLAAVLGTDKKINWTHQFATAWNDIDAGTEAPEDEVIRKLWAQVQPVLVSRLRYQTIVGCEPQYIEALAQAKSLLGISENDLKQWTKEAPENKKSKRSK